jgi:hypothetical protein
MEEDEKPANNKVQAERKQKKKRYERYLRIRNQTGEALTIWVQYHTRDEFGTSEWLPADPSESDEAVSRDIDRGKQTYVKAEDNRYLHASRIRLWATTASGKKYMKYAETDLDLVPEQTSNGTHFYYAPRRGTYTYTFNAKEGQVPSAEENRLQVTNRPYPEDSDDEVIDEVKADKDRPRLPRNIKRQVIGYEPDADDPDAPEIDQADKLQKQKERYLRLRNNSQETITVWVQYHSRDQFGAWWEWKPADPGYSDEAVSVEIAPGEATYVELAGDDEAEYLFANRVRLWGTTKSGKKYMKHAEKDLWLVPEKNSMRRHYYYAPSMGTYTYTFK